MNTRIPLAEAVKRARERGVDAYLGDNGGTIIVELRRSNTPYQEEKLANRYGDPSGGVLSESDAAVLTRLGVDAEVWTREFVRIFEHLRRTTGREDLLDPAPGSWLFGWFANAIAAGEAEGSRRVAAAHQRLMDQLIEDEGWREIDGVPMKCRNPECEEFDSVISINPAAARIGVNCVECEHALGDA